MLAATLCIIPAAYAESTSAPSLIVTFIMFTLFSDELIDVARFPALVIAFVIRGFKEFSDDRAKRSSSDTAIVRTRLMIGSYYLIRDLIVSAAQ